MTFRYFAYGSNLLPARMRSRCPSASVVGAATLDGWSRTYDKPGADGSAKLNVRPHRTDSVVGVIYEIDDSERHALDVAEPGYTPVTIQIEGHDVLTYTYRGEPFDGQPSDWYVDMVVAGSRHHGIG